MKKTMISGMLGCMILTGCGGSEKVIVREEKPEEHYYSEQEAEAYLMSVDAYQIGEVTELISEDGYFHYEANLKDDAGAFLTIGGTVSLTAEYNSAAGRWMIDTDENPVYTWNLEGSWYADLGSYEVYLTFHEVNGNEVRVTAEALFDKADGTGKGTYEPQEQTVSLKLNGTPVYDVYGSCYIFGGYPGFTLKVEKDRLLLYYNGDNNEAEMIRV